MTQVTPQRIPGEGWLALLGGGELTFGETEDADRAWLAKTRPGTIGFLPTASGSTDYGEHFAKYLAETFDRQSETIPIYRRRDARRGKNAERLAASAGIYLGGGVVDYLLDGFSPETPAAQMLRDRFESGTTVVAIAAAAQALGQVTRSLLERRVVDGLGWLPGGVVEANYDPEEAAAERRLRQLLEHPAVSWGVGIGAGSVLLLGPKGEVEVVGEAWFLDAKDGDPRPLT